MLRQIVLVIRFGRIEALQRSKLGHYGCRVRLCCRELLDNTLRRFLLLGIGKKDRRAVLAADIRPLTIEFRRIVRHGEEDVQ